MARSSRLAFLLLASITSPGFAQLVLPVPQAPGAPEFLVRSLETGHTQSQDSEAVGGLPGGLTAFVGEDGGPSGWDPRAYGAMTEVDPTLFPNRTACKVVSIFDDGNGGDDIVSSSGVMIDAETVLTAGSAIYRRTGTPGWAREVFVYPGFDGNGLWTTGAGTFQNFGMARTTDVFTDVNWVVSGDQARNVGALRLDRAVGFLTGWALPDSSETCEADRLRVYESHGYPASCSMALLQEWAYIFDGCSGDQRYFASPDQCAVKLTYGFEGAGVCYDAGFLRSVRGVLTHRTVGGNNYAAMLWPAMGTQLETFVAGSRGNTFDLQALNVRINTGLVAGQAIGTVDFLAANATNANPASATYTYRVYLSTDGNVTTADRFLGTRTVTRDFGGFSTYRVNFGDVLVPSNTPTGYYHLGVILDNATDADTTNNDTDDWDAKRVFVFGQTASNNACADAQALPLEVTVNGSNVAATNDGESFCGEDRVAVDDVWYSFVAPATTRYRVETLGGGTLADTVISVHTGCPGSTTKDLACDDNTGAGSLSRVEFTATRGQEYKIRVGGVNGTEGTFLLRADYAPPLNDTCTGSLFVGQGWHEGSLLGAGPTAAPCMGEAGGDVFYTFFPSCASLYAVSINGGAGTNASVLSVYRGCPTSGGQLVACDAGTENHPHGSAIFHVGSGDIMTIRVAAQTPADEGEFALSIRAYPFGSDLNTCFDATPVSTGVPEQFSTCGASVSAGNPPVPGCSLGLNDTVGPDRWFRWDSGSSPELATLSLCGSDFDTVAVVYEFNCPQAPTVIVGCGDNQCGDDPVINWITTPGTDYLIRVGGATTNAFLINQSGQGQLVVTTAPICEWQGRGCYADFNSDTGIDGDDVIEFFVEWDRGRGCADITRDGGVDGDDVIGFFEAWDRGGVGFPGC